MRNDYVLIGTDGTFPQVGAEFGAALGVATEPVDDLVTAQVGATGRVWLDSEELELLDDPLTPEYAGARFGCKVYDAAGPAAQRATARAVFDALSAATGWHLVLVQGEWGPTLAVRPAEAAAA